MKGVVFLRKLLAAGLAFVVTAALLSLGSFAAAGTAGYNVTMAGAAGNDMADDTAAIQSALNHYDSVYIPDGVYYINVDVSLHLRSNQTLTLSDGATLKALPSAREIYSVLEINNVSNVTVTGGRIVGDRAVHKGTSGEWGMGILINGGASNVTISNITVSDCWGDGVFLGEGASPVTDIKLANVTCDNNRRQGLSIIYARRVTISDCTFKNTHGTAPEAGIDIEPWADYTASDVTIVNTTCVGNAGSGLAVMGGKYTVTDIKVSGSTFKSNGGIGILACYASALRLTDSVVTDNYFGIEFPNDVSDVICSGLTVTGNRALGVSLVTSSQMGGVSNIAFENTVFANNGKNTPNTTDGVRIDKYDDSGYIRKISFTDCRFIDDQHAKTQRYGLSVGLFSSGISDILVDTSCEFSGNITGDYIAGSALKFL